MYTYIYIMRYWFRRKDMQRRLWQKMFNYLVRKLFDYLVRSVMSYGVEIWAEKKELEKVTWDYVRQLFKLKFCTPRYMMSRELKMKKLKIGWRMRTMRYEEKIMGEEEDK